MRGRGEALTLDVASRSCHHPLGEPRALDLFKLRHRNAWLAPLFDAEYGSASFVPVDRPMDLEVRVSTTGLLIREAKNEAKK